MPKETRQFDEITNDWKEITTRMYHTQNAFKASHHPGLFNTLNKLNDRLEYIQRALEIYLEFKRYVFPRFYFISNDDLLEILGNSVESGV